MMERQKNIKWESLSKQEEVKLLKDKDNLKEVYTYLEQKTS